jgi:hypothetical protein
MRKISLKDYLCRFLNKNSSAGYFYRKKLKIEKSQNFFQENLIIGKNGLQGQVDFLLIKCKGKRINFLHFTVRSEETRK